MKNIIRLSIHISSAQQSDLLLAELSEMAFYAFEELENSLDAYISGDDFDEVMFESVMKHYVVSYSKDVIPSKNWNIEWEKNYEPVIMNDFLIIRAPFHKPISGTKHDVVITPKMSFGTGHHATTYMMAEAMSNIVFNNKSVLDYGTGTGILAILAEKLGAASITAIDNDEWSIVNAHENVTNNNCKNIIIKQADTLIENTGFDIILCNINLNIILQNVEMIFQACKKNSIILLSGFLIEDELAIENKFSKKTIQTVKIIRDKWLLLGYNRN